ncbi:MAG: cytochrome c biogenesis CcdA family protein [Thermoplasmatota archaeon]
MTDPSIVGLAAFAFGEGVLSFLSPCGFPMLPAYVAYYVQSADAGEARSGESSPRVGWMRAAQGALAASAGALLLFGLVSYAVAAALGPIEGIVPDLELIGGLVVLAMGIATVAQRDWGFALPVRAPARRGMVSLFGFGALYAAVAAGCSIALLSVVIATGVAAHATALLLGVYAIGLVAMIAATTFAAALARNGLLGALRNAMPRVRVVAGSAMIVVGVYLMLYWYHAEISPRVFAWPFG